MCRPVTSFASLAERRSQKRSVPSKCPLTTIVPSAVTRTALTEEWHGSVLVQKPLPRSHTCTHPMFLKLSGDIRMRLQGDHQDMSSQGDPEGYSFMYYFSESSEGMPGRYYRGYQRKACSHHATGAYVPVTGSHLDAAVCGTRHCFVRICRAAIHTAHL